MKRAGTQSAFDEAYAYATRHREKKETTDRDQERKFKTIDLVENMNDLFRTITSLPSEDENGQMTFLI